MAYLDKYENGDLGAEPQSGSVKDGQAGLCAGGYRREEGLQIRAGGGRALLDRVDNDRPDNGDHLHGVAIKCRVRGHEKEERRTERRDEGGRKRIVQGKRKAPGGGGASDDEDAHMRPVEVGEGVREETDQPGFGLLQNVIHRDKLKILSEESQETKLTNRIAYS